MTLRHLPLLLACMALALAGCGRLRDAGERTINVSIMAGDQTPDQARAWSTLLADLQAATGMKVERFPGSNDTALVEAMRFRQTDFGWFTLPSGREAVRRAGGEVFARTVRPAAPEGDRAVIIVRKGSGVTLARLLACDRTLGVGLGEPGSISGDLAPATYLFAPRRVDPAACFKSVRTAGHESNLYAVSAGVLDAAVNDTAALARIGVRRAPGGGRLLDGVELIWASPPIPDDPLVWRKKLDPALKARIARFIFGYGVGAGPEAERQKAVLRRIDARAFRPADDSHLLPLREMEATGRLLRAEARQDPSAVAKAQAELDAATAARAAASR